MDAKNRAAIRARGPGGFGNHRKYQRLANTGGVVASYVGWVGPPRTHAEMMTAALHESAGDAARAFGHVYASMDVSQFGRTARFDYLQTIVELDLAPLAVDSPHLDGATGPLAGARLLFERPGETLSAHDLEGAALDLDRHLEVGPDCLEDALCNWQKSPAQFRPFRG